MADLEIFDETPQSGPEPAPTIFLYQATGRLFLTLSVDLNLQLFGFCDIGLRQSDVKTTVLVIGVDLVFEHVIRESESTMEAAIVALDTMRFLVLVLVFPFAVNV
jgi:hypothetical protein